MQGLFQAIRQNQLPAVAENYAMIAVKGKQNSYVVGQRIC